MSVHSIGEATGRLSELIDRALTGEGVLITRDGRPVVELRPVAGPPRPVTADELDWIARRRVGRPGRDGDAVASVRAERDEAWA